MLVEAAGEVPKTVDSPSIFSVKRRLCLSSMTLKDLLETSQPVKLLQRTHTNVGDFLVEHAEELLEMACAPEASYLSKKALDILNSKNFRLVGQIIQRNYLARLANNILDADEVSYQSVSILGQITEICIKMFPDSVCENFRFVFMFIPFAHNRDILSVFEWLLGHRKTFVATQMWLKEEGLVDTAIGHVTDCQITGNTDGLIGAMEVLLLCAKNSTLKACFNNATTLSTIMYSIDSNPPTIVAMQYAILSCVCSEETSVVLKELLGGVVKDLKEAHIKLEKKHANEIDFLHNLMDADSTVLCDIDITGLLERFKALVKQYQHNMFLINAVFRVVVKLLVFQGIRPIVITHFLPFTFDVVLNFKKAGAVGARALYSGALNFVLFCARSKNLWKSARKLERIDDVDVIVKSTLALLRNDYGGPQFEYDDYLGSDDMLLLDENDPVNRLIIV